MLNNWLTFQLLMWLIFALLVTFKSIQLEPTIGAWTGSAVNYYQKRKDFWESLLPLCNTIELLEHKQLIEKRLQGWRETIENEKRSEFMDDD